MSTPRGGPRRRAPGPDGGVISSPPEVVADTATDTATVADTATAPDTAKDTGTPCNCKPGDLWLHGPCVPTTKLGCAAVKTCTPGSCPGASQGKAVCDGTAASPACIASSLLPVCVKGPGMAFEPGSLRVFPTKASVGEQVKLTIQGGMFYIGALFWLVAVDGSPLSQVVEGKTCTVSATWTPKKKGLFPITAYYGTPDKGPGTINGTLAGFVSVGGPDAGTQPGQPCTSSAACAQAPPWACACVSGRCACTKK